MSQTNQNKMTSDTIPNDELIAIVKNGTFYFPANKRYTPTSIVICDRCRTYNISACLNYGDRDLCLCCVQDVTTKIVNKIRDMRGAHSWCGTCQDMARESIISHIPDSLVLDSEDEGFKAPSTSLSDSEEVEQGTKLLTIEEQEEVIRKLMADQNNIMECDGN
jgi:hypothetical protein